MNQTLAEINPPNSARPALEGGIPTPTIHEDWWSEVRAVFTKDLRSEFRTKSALSSILLFALTTLVLVGFLVQNHGNGLTLWWFEEDGKMVLRHLDTPFRAVLLSSLYWIILYFSAMAGLPRVFVKEEEMRTAAALRLAARPTSVYAGKLLLNLALLELITLLTLPLFILLFEPRPHDWFSFVGVLLTGAAAMAGTATILGAIAARSSNGGYLMLVLGFGPLLPVLIFGINGMTAAILGESGNNLVPLVSYLIAMVTVSALLFERVWGD